MEALTAGIAAAAALLGAALTGAFALRQAKLGETHGQERDLTSMRLPQYQKLFALTEAVPRQWTLSAVPRRAELIAIRERFHRWYFGEEAGGMFLSQAARAAYFALQNELQEAAARRIGETDVMTEGESSALRQKASNLRHQLSRDLGVGDVGRDGVMPESVPAAAPRQAA